MTITKQRVTCSDCSTVADVELVTDAPLAVSIASMRAARCPQCGSSKLGLGGEYGDRPPLTASIAERADWWKRRGEIGISSETIWSAFTGSTMGGHFGPDIPYDPDDFQRCKKLLDLIPEWRVDLRRVMAVYPWYAPFVHAWPEMESLWAIESPKKRCPRLYALMKRLEAESREIRRAGRS